MRGQQYIYIYIYIYIYTSYNICTNKRSYSNKRPHSAKLPYSNIITLRVRVRINRGSSSFNCSQTNGNAALQNKDPFEGIIEADVGDSAPERFYLR